MGLLRRKKELENLVRSKNLEDEDENLIENSDPLKSREQKAKIFKRYKQSGGKKRRKKTIAELKVELLRAELEAKI